MIVVDINNVLFYNINIKYIIVNNYYTTNSIGKSFKNILFHVINSKFIDIILIKELKFYNIKYSLREEKKCYNTILSLII